MENNCGIYLYNQKIKTITGITFDKEDVNYVYGGYFFTSKNIFII